MARLGPFRFNQYEIREGKMAGAPPIKEWASLSLPAGRSMYS